MGSTLNVSTHRALTLERVAKAWDKRPDLPLGELLVAAAGGAPLALLTNNQLAEAVERFVLLGNEPPASESP